MNFVYHNVPDTMVGAKIIPLNQMPDEMSDLKEFNLKKYEGREEILERQVPLLKCSWNDVLQFTPVHPQKVFELQVEMGLIPRVHEAKFFEIPIESFDPDKTAVFFKTAPGEENVRVKWLTDVNFDKLTEIPEATINYYKSLVGSGELPFNYQFIPHILYKGALDVSQINIITTG